MEKIIAIIVNEEGKKIEITPVDFVGSENSLEQMQEIIKVSPIAYHEITLFGIKYDIWYDDDFLARENQVLTWIDFEYGDDSPIVIMNNAVVAHADKEGNTIGLTEAEAVLFYERYRQHMESMIPKFEKWYNNVIKEKNGGDNNVR